MNNPNTYSYLQKNKEELAARDNGNKTYASWYAYGRTQSIVKPNSKEMIFIPTFNDPSNFKIYKRDSSLFISCIGIEIKKEHKNNISLDNIIQAITNNIPYIENNSSKRGGGWINVTTSVLKKINIE
jgi:hypothetical protein